MDYQEYLAHCPGKFTKQMEEYTVNEVFLESRYLFIWREGKDKVGYCTHCGEISGVCNGYRHNEAGVCPKCQSQVVIKNDKFKRGKIVDYAYFVFYEKSVINPKIIVAYGIEAFRDYRETYHDVQTKYRIEALYYFEIGNSTMFIDGYTGFNQHKTVFSLFSRKQDNGSWTQRMKRIYIGYSKQSLERAVIGTPFQYSCYSSYDYGQEDMVKFMSLYSQYPCIEYLTKMGMEDIVKAKLSGQQTYGVIYWRGKTLPKVLRLSKTIIKGVQKEKLHVTPILLKILQTLVKNGEKIPYHALKDINGSFSGYHFDELLKLIKYSSLSEIILYSSKQFNKDKKHYITIASAITTWRDYLEDCIKLKRDLNIDQMLYPSNLNEEHQKTISLIRQKEDAPLNKKIAVRVKKELIKYRFETEELFIRPAESTMELITEGNALHHCVGNYAKTYATGNTNIFFIRKVAEPDKSYFTLEFLKDKILQVRGFKNCVPSEDVSAFIDTFKEQKLTKKKAKLAVSA